MARKAKSEAKESGGKAFPVKGISRKRAPTEPTEPAGVPVSMDERISAAFSLISAGASARKAANQAGFAGKGQFWALLAEDEALQVRYKAAVAARAELYAEQITPIADAHPLMVATKYGEHVDAGFVAWQRNRIDARRWTAERLLPKRYGDRLDVNVTGGLALNVHTGQRPRAVVVDAAAHDDDVTDAGAVPMLVSASE